MREYVVERAEQGRHDDGDADDERGVGQRLTTGRPRDMAHFGARFLEIFGDFHIFVI